MSTVMVAVVAASLTAHECLAARMAGVSVMPVALVLHRVQDPKDNALNLYL